MQAAEQPLAAQPEAGESRGISLTVLLVLFLAAAAIVNPIDHSIVPTMGRMLTLELEPQRPPDPVRLFRQRTVDELDR